MARIGLIGMGNMGSAILNRLLKVYQPGDMIFTAAHREKMEKVTAETEVKHASSNRECTGQVRYLILAVKPQYFDIVFEEARDVVGPEQVIISLAPGISIGNIRTRLGGNVRVVRAMPNTPTTLGEGMIEMTYGATAYDEEEKRGVGLIFSSYGRMELMEERPMDAVNCVSGSSPVFVYMFIEALTDSGVECELPGKAAYAMATQTIMGSAGMVLGTGRHPGQLKGEVCLPGGTTIAGVSALEEHGFRSSVIQAADICCNRTQKMEQDLRQYEQIKIRKGLRKMEHKVEDKGVPVVRLGRELKHEGNILKMYKDTVLANGHEAKWGFIHHDSTAAVLPVVDGGEILMVHQYRDALSRLTLEIPAGKLGAPDEPKMKCVFRELEEETGFRVGSKGKLEYPISLTITVTFCDRVVDIFVAHNLIPPYQHLDEDEVISVVPYGLAELEEMIHTGKITDGKTIVAVMAYARKYRSADKKDDMV